jgi:hypothetical protein
MLIDMIRLITVALRPSPVSFQMIIFPTGIGDVPYRGNNVAQMS